jgi:hypothetical protein
MTPSGDSAEVIQFDKELIQDSALVEFRMRRMDSGYGEVSERLTHHTRRAKSLCSTKAALSFGLRAHRFWRRI